MKPDFETYLQQAREDFCKVAYKYSVTDHLELRTKIDSLLIAYDQAVEALRKHNVVRESPIVKEEVDLYLKGQRERLAEEMEKAKIGQPKGG